MEYTYYKPFSPERKELRIIYHKVEAPKIDWEDFVKTAELLKQVKVI
jgi:hypothetical protein